LKSLIFDGRGVIFFASMNQTVGVFCLRYKRNSTIDSHPNLEIFFADIDKRYKEIIGKKENKLELTKDELTELERL